MAMMAPASWQSRYTPQPVSSRFPARLHVLLVLVPGGDPPEEVLAFRQGVGEVPAVSLTQGAHPREHQVKALVGAGGFHPQISRAFQAGSPLYPFLENPAVPGRIALTPVADIVVADAVEVGEPASLDARIQNPLDTRMPVDRRLQVALVVTEVSLVENQVRPFLPDQLQHPVGPRTVARVSDEGHLEIGGGTTRLRSVSSWGGTDSLQENWSQSGISASGNIRTNRNRDANLGVDGIFNASFLPSADVDNGSFKRNGHRVPRCRTSPLRQSTTIRTVS